MPRKKLHLRTLMLMLSVGGILLTSLLLLSGLTIFQKGNIEHRLLENNLAYARKLADTTDRYLATAQRELIYSASKINTLNDKEHLQELKEHYQRGGLGDMKVKKVLSDCLIEIFEPIQKRRNEINKDELLVLLKIHTDKARCQASKTVSEVKQLLGLSIF